MPATLQVQLTGDIHAYERLGLAAPLILETMLRQAVTIGEDAAKMEAPRDTGALVTSITGRVYGFIADIESDSEYAVWQEIGRRANSTPPPADAIAGWAARHGFDTSRHGLYVLAQSIARNGFKGKHFMEAAMNEVERRFGDILEKGAAGARTVWGREL